MNKNTGDFAKGSSNSGVGTGGIYSFDVGSGNSALGIQPTGGDFTPGTFTLKLTNDTGNIIEDLDISYLAYIFNDQDRSSSFNFSYSNDDSTYTSVSSLDRTSTAGMDTTPTWVENPMNTTLSGANIADGSDFYLRWSSDDVDGSGARDQFALDDITFRDVPFEFSPSLGLLIIGSFSLVSYMKKKHQCLREQNSNHEA